MPIDKLIDSSKLDADITSIANAIRTKGETTEQLSFPDGMIRAIEYIETGCSYIIVTSNKGVLLTCDDQVYQLSGDETEHTFTVALGIHTVTATNINTGITVTDTVNVDINGVYEILLSANLLPFEYQQVEYIECTGTQYINTEYCPNSNTKVVMDFQMPNSISTQIAIVGTRQTAASFLLFTATNSTAFQMDYVSGSSFPGGSDVNINERSLIEMTNALKYKKQSSAGDFVVLKEFSKTTFTSTLPMYIFAINTGSVKQGSNMKLYSMEIYDSELKVKEFIPCYRKNDGKTGLYDVIEGKFYTNPKGNEFIVGDDV